MLTVLGQWALIIAVLGLFGAVLLMHLAGVSPAQFLSISSG